MELHGSGFDPLPHKASLWSENPSAIGLGRSTCQRERERGGEGEGEGEREGGRERSIRIVPGLGGDLLNPLVLSHRFRGLNRLLALGIRS